MLRAQRFGLRQLPRGLGVVVRDSGLVLQERARLRLALGKPDLGGAIALFVALGALHRHLPMPEKATKVAERGQVQPLVQVGGRCGKAWRLGDGERSCASCARACVLVGRADARAVRPLHESHARLRPGGGGCGGAEMPRGALPEALCAASGRGAVRWPWLWSEPVHRQCHKFLQRLQLSSVQEVLPTV